MVLFAVILPFTFFVIQTLALTCYETDKSGLIHAVSDPQYQYCVFLPRFSHNKAPATLFGIGPQNDDVTPYNTVFNSSNEYYKILSLCLFEKIVFSAVAAPNGRSVADEFMFRCLCNYDRCNSQKNFDKYLIALQKDSIRRNLN